MRKRIIAVLLAISIVFSLGMTATAWEGQSGLGNFVAKNTYYQGLFQDVPASAWYAENVATAYKLGLMVGSSTTTFNPNGYVTQAEALTIAARLHKIYHTGNDDFSDIKTEMQSLQPTVLEWVSYDTMNPAYNEVFQAWYSVYAYYLSNHTDDVTMCYYPLFPFLGADPSGAPFIDAINPITRAEFVAFLAHALPSIELQEINSVVDGAIPDISYEESPEAYLLYRAGVLTGSDNLGTFAPQSAISRAEVAAIIGRMVNPQMRKQIHLQAGLPQAGLGYTLKVEKNNITVNSPTALFVTVLGDKEKVICTYDSQYIDVEWGSWDGDNIPLIISPKKNGTASIKVYYTDGSNESKTITVTIVGCEEVQSSSGSALQYMAAIGINEAYWSAKYPATLHLNSITYSDKMTNGYGDEIIRMVLRFYAANSLGGYGDLYVTVLCCDHPADYLEYSMGGLYFSASCYNSRPAWDDYYMSNAEAMRAYKTLINNPKEIPYD